MGINFYTYFINLIILMLNFNLTVENSGDATQHGVEDSDYTRDSAVCLSVL